MSGSTTVASPSKDQAKESSTEDVVGTAYDRWLYKNKNESKWEVRFALEIEPVQTHAIVIENPENVFKFYERGYMHIECVDETLEQKFARIEATELRLEHKPWNVGVDNYGNVVSSDAHAAAAKKTNGVNECLKINDTIDNLMMEVDMMDPCDKRVEKVERLQELLDTKVVQNQALPILYPHCKYLQWEPPMTTPQSVATKV